MKIIKPSYEILTKINRAEVLRTIETAARTCYKSEHKMTAKVSDSAKFVENLIKREHYAMIEFFDITVKFIHNRGFSHEMVRHRHCSFAQESTRYVNYNGSFTVIEPYWYEKHDDNFLDWKKHIENSELAYNKLTDNGLSPQAARLVLPINIKTEIVVKANLREWRHIFDLRCSSGAHPDMRRVMIPLRDELTEKLPEIFGEVKNEKSKC